MVVDDQARAILTRALITGEWRAAIRELQALEAAMPSNEKEKHTGVSRTDVRQVMVEEIQRGKPRRVLFFDGRVEIGRPRAGQYPKPPLPTTGSGVKSAARVAAERIFAPADA